MMDRIMDRITHHVSYLSNQYKSMLQNQVLKKICYIFEHYIQPSMSCCAKYSTSMETAIPYLIQLW